MRYFRKEPALNFQRVMILHHYELESSNEMNGIDDTVHDYQERIRKELVKRLPDFSNLVEKNFTK